MNKLEALGNKIRELRERKNWSLDRLSEELEKEDIEIVPSTLFRIEKGQRKKIDTLLLLGLSKILNYNFFQMLDNQIFRSEDYIEVDDQKLYIYGFASAGNGYLDTTDYEIMEVSLPKNIRHKKGLFGIKVHGESMEPEFYNNDILILDPSCPEWEELNNKVIVVDLNNERYVKLLKYYNDGRAYLFSYNEIYPPIQITENDNIKCIGKVVYSFRSYS